LWRAGEEMRGADCVGLGKGGSVKKVYKKREKRRGGGGSRERGDTEGRGGCDAKVRQE